MHNLCIYGDHSCDGGYIWIYILTYTHVTIHTSRHFSMRCCEQAYSWREYIYLCMDERDLAAERGTFGREDQSHRWRLREVASWKSSTCWDMTAEWLKWRYIFLYIWLFECRREFNIYLKFIYECMYIC